MQVECKLNANMDMIIKNVKCVLSALLNTQSKYGHDNKKCVLSALLNTQRLKII